MTGADKRTNRVPSTTERQAAVAKPSSIRRQTFASNVRSSNDETQDPSFTELSLAQVKDALQEAERYFFSFEKEHLAIVSELQENDETFQQHQDLYVDVLKIYKRCRRNMCQRIADLTPIAEPQMVAEQQQQQAPVPLVMQADVSNMRNTWGTFAGDYAKWHSFRDRFKQAVHDETKVPVILKFQWLMQAVKGEAANAMGEWKLEAANYYRAWNQLCDVYEDDYLAVQTFVRRLLSVPRMTTPTYKGMRKIIDTINECVQQLANFVDTTNWDPITVFLAIDLMDQSTFEAWESNRERAKHENVEAPMDVDENQVAGGQTSNAEANSAANVSAANISAASAKTAETKRTNIFIPSWIELRAFLEKRARILVHAEQRDRSVGDGSQNPHRGRDNSQSSNRAHDGNQNTNRARDSSQAANRGGARPKVKQEKPQRQKAFTGYPPCPLCNEDHPLYKCGGFREMNLNGRYDFVRTKGLCHCCLKATDHFAAQCDQIGCDKCPSKPKHNGLLCQTKEALRRTANLAMEVDAPAGRPSRSQKRPNFNAS